MRASARATFSTPPGRRVWGRSPRSQVARSSIDCAAQWSHLRSGTAVGQRHSPRVGTHQRGPQAKRRIGHRASRATAASFETAPKPPAAPSSPPPRRLPPPAQHRAQRPPGARRLAHRAAQRTRGRWPAGGAATGTGGGGDGRQGGGTGSRVTLRQPWLLLLALRQPMCLCFLLPSSPSHLYSLLLSSRHHFFSSWPPLLPRGALLFPNPFPSPFSSWSCASLRCAARPTRAARTTAEGTCPAGAPGGHPVRSGGGRPQCPVIERAAEQSAPRVWHLHLLHAPQAPWAQGPRWAQAQPQGPQWAQAAWSSPGPSWPHVPQAPTASPVSYEHPRPQHSRFFPAIKVIKKKGRQSSSSSPSANNSGSESPSSASASSPTLPHNAKKARGDTGKRGHVRPRAKGPARKGKTPQEEESAEGSGSSSEGKGRKFSKASVTLGLEGNKSYPRKRRWRLVCNLLPAKVNLVRHNSLTTHQLDQLIFIATGCAPTSLLGDFKSVGTRTHGQLAELLSAEAKARTSFVHRLSEDFHQLVALGRGAGMAARVGWQIQDRARQSPRRHSPRTTGGRGTRRPGTDAGRSLAGGGRGGPGTDRSA